jgi:hypothetical protein
MMSDEKAAEMAVVPTDTGRDPGNGRYRGDRDNGVSKLVPDQRDLVGALVRELDSRRTRDRRTGGKMDKTGRRHAVLVILACLRYGFAVIALLLIVLSVASLWTL